MTEEIVVVSGHGFEKMADALSGVPRVVNGREVVRDERLVNWLRMKTGSEADAFLVDVSEVVEAVETWVSSEAFPGVEP